MSGIEAARRREARYRYFVPSPAAGERNLVTTANGTARIGPGQVRRCLHAMRARIDPGGTVKESTYAG